MGERGWLLRDAVVRIVADAPLPPATTTSVVRRAVVVTAAFLIGVLAGDLTAGVLAAFGALQVGLIEAALPLGRLLRLLVLVTVSCTLVVAVALALGSTWAAVVLVVVLGYVYGCTAGLSPTAAAVGISVLAMAVIFAGLGLPRDGIVADTGWVLAGIAAQNLAWLAVWRPERRMFARRALANKLRTDVLLLRPARPDAADLVRTHVQTDVIGAVLDSAGFPAVEGQRMREAMSATVRANRAVIAWTVLRQPGDAERMTVGRSLAMLARRLTVPWPTRPPVLPSLPDPDATTGRGVAEAIAEVDDAVGRVVERGEPTGRPIALAARPSAPAPARSIVDALRPGGPASRHGARMAIGLGVAEALSLLVPVTHSFWLPLTVVFTLKSDWAFTVIRGVNRTIGNLAAVILLPALLLAVGPDDAARVLPVLVLSAVTFRWFFGNYVIASFGLAGTVLLLDETLSPDSSLFATRIIAAVVGAVLSLAVAWIMPTWPSAAGPAQARELGAVIGRWRDDVRRRAAGGAVSDDDLDRDVVDARRALGTLDATATGALLEPRGGSPGVGLALVVASAAAEVLALMAATYYLMGAGPGAPDPADWAHVEDHARLRQVAVASDAALIGVSGLVG